MDVQSAIEGFNEFVDNSYEDHMENRFLYAVGNTVSFRTSCPELWDFLSHRPGAEDEGRGLS